VQTGFFSNLTHDAFVRTFPGLLPSSGQRPQALRRRIRPLDQEQTTAIIEDNRPDARNLCHHVRIL
jgi:hypothetical protein